jgi:hypothetical protein
LFHRSVVLEEGNVVGGGFDAQNTPRFVVHLDAGGSHVMADPCSLNASIEVVAEFGAEVAGEATAEEGRDVLRLDGVDRGAAKRP